MIWIFAIALAGSENPAALLQTGIFHGDEVAAEDGSAWMALVPSNGRFVWRKSRLEVKTVLDAVTGQMNAKQVSIAGNLQPVLLLERVHSWMSRSATAVIDVRQVAGDLKLGDGARSGWRWAARSRGGCQRARECFANPTLSFFEARHRPTRGTRRRTLATGLLIRSATSTTAGVLR